jgi:hypothetical protein
MDKQTQADYYWIKRWLARLLRFVESQPIILFASDVNINWLYVIVILAKLPPIFDCMIFSCVSEVPDVIDYSYHVISCWLVVRNKAVRYCRDNEASRIIKIVHIAADLDEVPVDFADSIRILNACYPSFRIDATVIEGEFNPETVQEVAQFFGMSRHNIFIGCPGPNFKHSVADFGGVRIITARQNKSEKSRVLAMTTLDGPPVAPAGMMSAYARCVFVICSQHVCEM